MMYIALSIIVGVTIALISYRVLFEDGEDLLKGISRALFRPRSPISRFLEPKSDDFADEVWAGYRFFFLLLLSVGGAVLVYYGLTKYF